MTTCLLAPPSQNCFHARLGSMQKVHKTTFKVDKVKPGSAKLKPFHDAHDRFRGLLEPFLCVFLKKWFTLFFFTDSGS